MPHTQSEYVDIQHSFKRYISEIFRENSVSNYERFDCKPENGQNNLKTELSSKSNAFDANRKLESNEKDPLQIISEEYSFEDEKMEVISTVGNIESDLQSQNTFNSVAIKQETDTDAVIWNSLTEEKTEKLYIGDQEITLKEYKIESWDDIKLEETFTQNNIDVRVKLDVSDVDSAKEEATDKSSHECVDTQEKGEVSLQKQVKHKCDQCPFETKYPANVKQHMKTHKDLSERKKYSCEHCNAEFVTKKGFKMHIFWHKDPSEWPMLRCDTCDFATMYKSALTSHKLAHRDSSEVETFKCGSCDYETRCRSYYNRHMRNRHAEALNSSKRKLYECGQCNSKLVSEDNFKRHMLIHQNSSKRQLFPCDECEYKTGRKSTLKQHKLRHLPLSEVPVFKCNFCDYSTKYKSGLVQHIQQSHRKSSLGRRSYDCEHCGVKLATRTSLRMHLLKHKEKSEVTHFPCDLCEYKSIYKSCVKRHKAMMHADHSELKTLACKSCDFVTKYKASLMTHFKRHHLK